MKYYVLTVKLLNNSILYLSDFFEFLSFTSDENLALRFYDKDFINNTVDYLYKQNVKFPKLDVLEIQTLDIKGD